MGNHKNIDKALMLLKHTFYDVSINTGRYILRKIISWKK